MANKEEIKDLSKLRQDIEKLIGTYNDLSKDVDLGSKLALLEGAFTFSLGTRDDEEEEEKEDWYGSSGCEWQSSSGCEW